MIVIYAPFPSPELVRGGWMRRIATLESIFADRERHYVFPGDAAWSADPRDYRVHSNDVAKGAKFTWLDLRFSSHHRFLAQLIDRSDFVYAHTSHSAQHLLPYYATGKIVTDLHGIAPEEERLQEKPGRAAFYEAFEETMVRESALLVSVTEAMLVHMRAKYPGLDTDSVLLPIVEDVGEGVSMEREARDRPRVVYAGGLQKWQNVDRMLDVVAECRDRCEFAFYTDDPDRLRELAKQRDVDGTVSIGTAAPEKLASIYAQADLGFVLRDDIAVNRVSCPTKLSEYLACGVVPIVDLVEIGDFASMGYRYVTVEQLRRGELPDADELAAMRRQNREVFEQVQQRFTEGRARLQQPVAVRESQRDQRALQLTTMERAVFYPRRGTKLEIERDDGKHAVPFDDVAEAVCECELELPGTGALRAVRFCPGDAPFVTSPIAAEIIDEDGRSTAINWDGAVEADRFGNWKFATLGATVSANAIDVARPKTLRLRYEYLLIGPEAFVVGIEPSRGRSSVLQKLAKVPGARPVWAALQSMRRRLGMNG